MDLETRIEDLLDKFDIEDDNLLIVEDKEDTKKSTIEELKKAFKGDNKNPSELRFYSSDFMNKKLEEILNNIKGKVNNDDFKKLSDRVSQIVASSGSGKDTEVIDARDGEVSLHERIVRDYKI